MNQAFLRALLALSMSCLLSNAVWAHALNPGYLALERDQEGPISVQWNPPSAATSDPVPGMESLDSSGPIFPETCTIETMLPLPDKGWIGKAHCSTPGLPQVEVMGLDAVQSEVVVSWRNNQDAGTLVLASPPRIFDGATTTVSSQPAFTTYFGLGWDHILEGYDHLLFVLGLLLLLVKLRPTILAITAFTVAHGVSLALSVSGWVQLGQRPVEILIALSIVVLGIEISRGKDQPPSLSTQYPWVVAFAFGLLHGLGFAGAMREIGLPPDQILLPLVGFNLGVEAGQILFVCVAGLALYILRKSIRTQAWTQRAAGAIIGIPGIIWVVQRSLA